MVLEGFCDIGGCHDHGRVRHLDRITSTESLHFFRFLIFPSSFNNNVGLTVNKTSAGVIAGVLLALGFILSAALAFICKSWLFRLETLVM